MARICSAFTRRPLATTLGAESASLSYWRAMAISGSSGMRGPSIRARHPGPKRQSATTRAGFPAAWRRSPKSRGVRRPRSLRLGVFLLGLGQHLLGARLVLLLDLLSLLLRLHAHGHHHGLAHLG